MAQAPDSMINSGLPVEADRGDESSFANLLEQYRPGLRRMLSARLDTRLQNRVDPSDIIQETYVEATRRRGEFLRQSGVPLGVWLTFLARQQLLLVRRRHFGTLARDPRREVLQPSDPQDGGLLGSPAQSGDGSSGLAAAIAAELRVRVRQVLSSLCDEDREILLLRHDQQLSNGEAADRLGLKPSAACNRYVRALARLRNALLETHPGSTDWRP